MELASSIEPLRRGLDMLDRDIGLRKAGFFIEKLLGGAAPRIDLRGFAMVPARAVNVFEFDAVADVPALVEPEKSEANDSWDSLWCSGRETRLAVEPMCCSWLAGERIFKKRA